MNVKEHYINALAKKGYKADASQLNAISKLQNLAVQLNSYSIKEPNVSSGLFSGLLKSFKTKPVKPTPKGLYMWGGVGRGKSFVMDSFYACINMENKTRVHFHEFMRSIHNRLQEISKQADPLDIIATNIANKYTLICFDEFHVSDIADAMILYRLLNKFFEKGVVFVMTSNYEPTTLYPDGLHRDRLIPAINLILERIEVINVDVGVDYRLRELEQLETYYTPIDSDTNSKLQNCFSRLSSGQVDKDSISVQNRELKVVCKSANVLWVDFYDMCVLPRSQIDYLEIANEYHTIILSNVPKMTPQDASAARRFTWMVDVFYDHKVKLVISAQVPAEELFMEGIFANEFSRTVSRMIEMRSTEYMQDKTRKSVDV
ncbi:cell division protein ZapE [Taylorella equigenitalis]|uniref:cell division protein ZapE n=1 Tax=Taylorella equigenitalis TaxID=29575 RepID=UPI0004125B08|nr:cell division protein ZapE [Taylorella equigenitalis]WDU53993.1 AFG1 family ATPase [Taylorella equigenitalis]